MSVNVNEFQQPVGETLEAWEPRPLPQRVTLFGRFCRLEPLSADHIADLLEAYGNAEDGRDWTYMFSGPFSHEDEFRRYLSDAAASRDPLHFAVIDAQGERAVGTVALMRIAPQHGVIEVGHVAFSPLLQRTPAATETHFLLMQYAFEQLGYRRYEWKCDSLNAPSRKAALRLGFRYEGLFRQAIVYKGRTRDTTWFSIIDSEWPAVRQGFVRWLDERNFDPQGQQRHGLAALRNQ